MSKSKGCDLMKAFIYTKDKASKKIGEFNNVVKVEERNREITIYTVDGTVVCYDCRKVKTRVYQN